MRSSFLAMSTAAMLLLSGLVPCGALAQQQRFTVDPDASSITFKLSGSAHDTEGTFRVKSGAVEFDRSAAKISGLVVVSASSGNTGNGPRDERMWGEVLEISKFADISFAPKSYQGTIAASGDSTIQVSGIFTVHGGAHGLTVPMQVHIEGDRCTAKTHFAVPYVKWGMKDPSVFILRVAKEVDVDLTLIGKLAH